MLALALCLCFLSTFASLLFGDSDVNEIDSFLEEYNKEGSDLYNNESKATWAFETDQTKVNRLEMKKWSIITANFSKRSSKTARSLLKEVDTTDVPPSKLRQLKLIQRTASSDVEGVNKEATDIVSKMSAIYENTKMTKKGSSGKFTLERDLLHIMSNVSAENLANLEWAFEVLRKDVGTKIKPLYERFVILKNYGARENGYKDYGDYWRKEYEDDNLEEHMESILNQMGPLYKKMHAYVRFKLNKFLGDDVVGESGTIPIHLLNMWGQNWRHLYNILVPYPNVTVHDVTKEMNKKRWQNMDLLKLADSFFVSLGMEKMQQRFFEKSMIERNPEENPVCFPSSFDLGNGDVRIKMPCMRVAQSSMITVHHEMGHIEYYLMYQHQPLEFRTSANPGFHEAVGDAIALSVMSPKHLESIGLLNVSQGSEAEGINFLLKQALDHLAFIPFSYIIDKWRWSVFSGNTTPGNYNRYWWELRKRYQGVSIPNGMKRNDSELCDPGTFFHVAHDTEYLRYFMSTILQFQFHKALCDEAKVEGPYHKCSIYKSKEAGSKLREMMQLGRRLPWVDALAVLTGTRKLSSKPMKQYFKPLEEWLDEHRKVQGYKIGWDLRRGVI